MNTLAIFKDAWKNRHKQGDNKKPQQLAAFLPAMLEIQETPPNPLSRWLAWSLLVLVLIAIIWACLGQINIVASAEGKIIPSSRVKQIQPSENGVVKAIFVSEGDYVTQGQPLVELDATSTAADKNRLQSELHSLTLNLAINQALIKQIETVSRNTKKVSSLSREKLLSSLSPVANPQESQLYQQLLWEQWQQFWTQYQSLHSGLRKNQAEQGASKEIISKLEQTLPIAKKRASSLKKLHQKNLVSETTYLKAKQERIQNKQDLAAERQRYLQYKASEAEINDNINTHIAQTSATVLTQMADYQRQIAAVKEELIKATNLDEKQILYAPVSGQVQELAINTVGGVVTQAQQLMLIVPDEKQLEVEVFLENKDIGFVHKDMLAEVKIHTFPFTKYGVIDAVVSNVSNDAIVDEQRGLIYSMQLRMAKNTIAVNGKGVNLLPGMAVTAEVKTGTRRIIEFFLAPLLRAKSESIRER